MSNERTPEGDELNESEPEDYVFNPTPFRRELGWYEEMLQRDREFNEDNRWSTPPDQYP